MRSTWLQTATVSIGAMLACTACALDPNAPRIVTGSGKEISQERKIATGLTGVETDLPSPVLFTAGKPQRVVITGDDNVVPLIKVEPYGHVLKIRMPGIFINATARVQVDSPDISSASAIGSGPLELRNLNAKDFKVSSDGAGNVTVSGACENLELILTGSGDIDASKLKCTAASVLLEGAGNATVAPKQHLQVSLTGSGNVICIGKPPSVTKEIKGSGRLEYK